MYRQQWQQVAEKMYFQDNGPNGMSRNWHFNGDDDLEVSFHSKQVDSDYSNDLMSLKHSSQCFLKQNQILPNTDFNEEIDSNIGNFMEIDSKSSTIQKSQSSKKVKQPIKQVLSLQNDDKLFQRHKTLKGECEETKNLLKKLYTDTKQYLIMLQSVHILDGQAKEALRQFIPRNTNYSSFQKLFQCEQIRQKCQQYYQSNEFIKKILRSSKMHIKTKLLFIKHMQGLRQLVHKPKGKRK